MLTLSAWPLADRQRITGVFTDIDDTLTTGGEITADALQALGELKAAGLQVVAITGRPIGWSEPFAAVWPVDAIVAENGAAALVPATNNAEKALKPKKYVHRQLSKIYQQDEATRTANRSRMQAVLKRIEAEIPGVGRATDSPGRETDIAIDHSEFAQLNAEQIARVVSLMQSEGMHATVSSIHINGWYGDHDKLEGARWIVQQLWQRDLDREMDRWLYVGDSTNDQLMFKSFANSFGVANIAFFVPQMLHLPRYVTRGERGAGFCEVTRALLG